MKFLLNWVWPEDRCRTGSVGDWREQYFRSDLQGKSLGVITRAADGRFVLRDSGLSSRAGSVSNSSSSDDGGFLPRRGIRNRASWRRPLVGFPSQLSLRSDGSGQSARQGIANFLGGFMQPRFIHPPIKPIPAIYSLQPPLTPSNPRFQSSSPATSSNVLLSPWSPLYFSDLSSVRQPSSAERSYPTPPGYMQLRNMHERYSQELPSLRAIHEETFNNQFIPVHPITASPTSRLRFPPPYPSGHMMTARPRARLLPRHARIARSAPELASPDHTETSPESRSSSSGFGSKNTSSNQNQSSQSGSTFTEWRLPPYRPPPPPPPHLLHQQQLPPPPPPLVGHWLDRLHDSSPHSSELPLPLPLPHHKQVDVGSVDGHYEFDPATPTPTPSTPTGGRDDPKTLTRFSRYDNIEARVQAMKEEFHEFRKRQAKRRRSHELESAC